jgi:hypothetical protein
LGSKKYKNKPCVYCRKQPSEDGDHVVCREFFPLNRRANLPKVPACKGCNNDKSLLEHYLTAVLPFGARHQDAHAVIEMTPARLARNRALHERLALGLRHILRATNGGPWEMGLTVPLDSQAVEKLFEFVVKGLAWHHWRLELDDSHFVRASFLTAAGGQRFEPFFRGNARTRVNENLAAGGFSYEGVQAQDNAALTLWRMSLYGLEVGGGQPPGERANLVYGITAPRAWRVTGNLAEILAG